MVANAISLVWKCDLTILFPETVTTLFHWLSLTMHKAPKNPFKQFEISDSEVKISVYQH